MNLPLSSQSSLPPNEMQQYGKQIPENPRALQMYQAFLSGVLIENPQALEMSEEFSLWYLSRKPSGLADVPIIFLWCLNGSKTSSTGLTTTSSSAEAAASTKSTLAPSTAKSTVLEIFVQCKSAVAFKRCWTKFKRAIR